MTSDGVDSEELDLANHPGGPLAVILRRLVLDLSWLELGLVVLGTWWILFRPTLRGMAFGALGLFRRFNMLRMRFRGTTAQSEADARVVRGQAWDEFCDALKAAGGALVYSGAPQDPFNQAEGYRYLTRVLRGALENFVDCSDPAAPQLTSIVNGLRSAPVKLGSDNPDNYYQQATISGRLAYRVTGTRGTVHYLGFGAQAGQYGRPGGLKTVSYLEASAMHFEADGSFQLVASPERPPGCRNWLQTATDPEQGLLIVRQTFQDQSTEKLAEVRIERLDGQTTPSLFSCQRLEEGLQSTALMLAGAPLMFARWAEGFQRHANQLPLFDQKLSDSVGGDPNIRYFHSYWALREDQALVIEATPPPCDHWNFQLNNYWMESLDYRYHNIAYNKHTARYFPDATVRLIVTARDPNVGGKFLGNWVATVGHTSGTMCFRWIKPGLDGAQLPMPRTRVVPVEALRSLDPNSARATL